MRTIITDSQQKKVIGDRSDGRYGGYFVNDSVISSNIIKQYIYFQTLKALNSRIAPKDVRLLEIAGEDDAIPESDFSVKLEYSLGEGEIADDIAAAIVFGALPKVFTQVEGKKRCSGFDFDKPGNMEQVLSEVFSKEGTAVKEADVSLGSITKFFKAFSETLDGKENLKVEISTKDLDNFKQEVEAELREMHISLRSKAGDLKSLVQKLELVNILYPKLKPKDAIKKMKNTTPAQIFEAYRKKHKKIDLSVRDQLEFYAKEHKNVLDISGGSLQVKSGKLKSSRWFKRQSVDIARGADAFMLPQGEKTPLLKLPNSMGKKLTKQLTRY